MKTCGIYARISSQSQNSDRQVDDLQDFANNEGLQVVGIYKDTLSGFKDNELRPDLTRLKTDAALKKFDVILFSEFSRLSRKVGDLTNLIDLFRSFGTELYFQKQNIWCKDKNDIGTSILIQVLGVVSQYEIELFAERSMSGKISAIKNKGTNDGGLTPLGYMSEAGTKKLIINQEEAKLVKRIFQLYADGFKSLQICDLLNGEGIKSPYSLRLQESKARRKTKGIEDKKYKFYDVDALNWLPSTLNRMVKNELYKGIRKCKMHKPDPTKKNGKREILEEIIIVDESLRIIDDTLFEMVTQEQAKNNNRKFTGVLHGKLFNPDKIKCGNCGNSYVGGVNAVLTYKDYGSIRSMKTREKLCNEGQEIAQPKLNGVVLAATLRYMLDEDYKKNSLIQIDKLKNENSIIGKIVTSKKNELEEVKNNWIKFFKKAVQFDFDNETIETEKILYNEKVNSLNSDIDKNENTIIKNNISIISLNKHSEDKKKIKFYDAIKDKAYIKQMVDEYIELITVYYLYEKYSLVVIKLDNGAEVYTMVKSAKYRKDEEKFNFEFNKVSKHTIYFTSNNSSIVFDNKNKCFIYNGKSFIFKFSGFKHKIEAGTYPAKEWIQLLKDNEHFEFPFEEFDYDVL